MGTGRKFNKQPVSRPKKSGAVRKRRDKVHVGRLVKMGMDGEVVRKMTTRAIKDLLKAPKKTAIAIAAGKL